MCVIKGEQTNVITVLHLRFLPGAALELPGAQYHFCFLTAAVVTWSRDRCHSKCSLLVLLWSSLSAASAQYLNGCCRGQGSTRGSSYSSSQESFLHELSLAHPVLNPAASCLLLGIPGVPAQLCVPEPLCSAQREVLSARWTCCGCRDLDSDAALEACACQNCPVWIQLFLIFCVLCSFVVHFCHFYCSFLIFILILMVLIPVPALTFKNLSLQDKQ